MTGFGQDMDKLIPGILIAALSAVTFFTFGWVEILCYVQFLYWGFPCF